MKKLIKNSPLLLLAGLAMSPMLAEAAPATTTTVPVTVQLYIGTGVTGCPGYISGDDCVWGDEEGPYFFDLYGVSAAGATFLGNFCYQTKGSSEFGCANPQSQITVNIPSGDYLGVVNTQQVSATSIHGYAYEYGDPITATTSLTLADPPHASDGSTGFNYDPPFPFKPLSGN